MGKGFLTTHPRERRLAMIAAVLIGCWGLVSWVAQPLWDRIQDARSKVELQTEKLDALRRLLAEASAIEQDYAGRASYLDAADDERAQSAFLNTLETLSRDANLQVDLKPRPMKREGRLSRFEVELSVEGSQEQLLGFLDALLGMPRLITIERMRLSSIPLKENWVRANLVIQKLALH